MRQRRKNDEKILQARPYALGQYVLGVSECHTSRRDEKATKEMERPVHDNGIAPIGSVLSLEHRVRGTF